MNEALVWMLWLLQLATVRYFGPGSRTLFCQPLLVGVIKLTNLHDPYTRLRTMVTGCIVRELN